MSVMTTVMLAGVVGAGVGTAVGFVTQRRAAQAAERLVSLPSGIEGIEAPTPLVRFFAATHDLTMLVTEAWNAKGARSEATTMAQLLRVTDLEEVRERLRSARAEVDAALAGYGAALNDLRDLPESVQRVWTSDRRDHYRTIEDRDSNGNRRTREVYDKSDYRFQLHDERVASVEPRVRIWARSFDPAVLQVLSVHGLPQDLQRLPAAERSLLERTIQMSVTESDAAVAEDDVAFYMRQWLDGPMIHQHLSETRGFLRQAHAQVDPCFRALATAPRLTEFTATNTTEVGPLEQQESNGLADALNQAMRSWERVRAILDGPVRTADELLERVRSPETSSDRTYVDLAVASYESVFPGSMLAFDPLPSASATATRAGIAAVVTSAVFFTLHPGGLAALL